MARVAQLEPPADPLRGGAGAGSKAKLALVEALLAEQEVRPCALFVLRWLARPAGIERGFCAVTEGASARLARRPGALFVRRGLARHAGIERGFCAVTEGESGRLAGLTGIGVPLAGLESFTLNLDARTHPVG